VKNAGTSTAFVLCALLFPFQVAFAHHPSVEFGTEVVGPISTIPAVPMEKNGWSAAMRTDYPMFNRFSDSEMESLASSGTETHSMDDQASTFLFFPGIFDEKRFTARNWEYTLPDRIRQFCLIRVIQTNGGSRWATTLSVL